MLDFSLRFTIVGVAAVIGLICLILSYQALFDTICGNLHDAARGLFWGLTSGVGALLLIKYRDDLIDA